MDYLKRLKELEGSVAALKEEALLNGYVFENGKFVKNESKQAFLEVYIRAETKYESYGNFGMYRKVFPISEERFREIQSIPKDLESVHDFFMEDLVETKNTTFNELLDYGSNNYDDLEFIRDILSSEDGPSYYPLLEDEDDFALEFKFGVGGGSDGFESHIDGFVSCFKALPSDVNTEIVDCAFIKALCYQF